MGHGAEVSSHFRPYASTTSITRLRSRYGMSIGVCMLKRAIVDRCVNGEESYRSAGPPYSIDHSTFRKWEL